MKDFTYNDVPGLESVDTQQQLDTFEAINLMGSKDRFIFDFSGALNYYPSFESENVNEKRRYEQFWKNDAWWDSKWDTRLGVPGESKLFCKGFFNYSNKHLTPSISYIPTVLGEDFNYSPKFNEDAAIFVGQKYAGLFGEGTSSTNPDAISTIRSGYYEFTIKTDKQNCIIGYGSHSSEFGYPSAIDSNSIALTENSGDDTTFKILIENGKLKIEYISLSGNNKTNFSVIGNNTISDDQWHHIVVNLGKPGVKRTHSKKYNERFIEFWIDGQLDKKTNEHINEQIFFPTITWLLVDPTLSFAIDNDPWMTIDYSDSSGVVQSVVGPTISSSITIGNNELEVFFGADQGVFNEKGTPIAFSGSIHTYVAGYNQCLDKFEIQFRNNLWRGLYRNTKEPFTANAVMVSPKIETNKKKALRLFWNNLVNTKAVNGIELDGTYQIDSLSTTHRIANSPSEVYNIDLSNDHKLSYLKDVRVAVKDNILILRPGAVWVQNFEDVAKNVGVLYQNNMYDLSGLNGIGFSNLSFQVLDYTQKTVPQLSGASLNNISVSGVNLVSGDRILLTNQFNPSENGIYVFHSLDTPLTRAEDANSSDKLNNGVVRVIDGYYKNTSWFLSSNISTLNQKQKWIELESHPTSETINSQPIFGTRWSNENGDLRLIDLEQDLDINQYDLIVFMNYPETNEEVKEHLSGFDDFEIKVAYEKFIKSLENVCAQGASLYVSSPKLAQDLGIIKSYELIDQAFDAGDAQSASISPFELNESAENYFDTHRINQYNLATEVPGLTNKETYILTDFINYVPSNVNDYEQYHAKYAYRQFGIKEGNQFFIPSLALRSVSKNENLPGFSANRRGIKPFIGVEPHDINVGTIVTKLANTYYQNGTIVNNPHDDDATTIIVHNGQVLNGQPITGKIFVNFIEDGFTMSREEYNKAFIQVIPTNDTNETNATRAWQYSTTRLNRVPQRTNIRELTEYGQTTPTNGGGGALIQAPTNSSNGIIRSETDSGNINYQSDLYPSEAEEIYEIQEIPVLSMTYLGLQWLAE